MDADNKSNGVTTTTTITTNTATYNYPSRIINQSPPSISPTFDASPIMVASKRSSQACDKFALSTMGPPIGLTVGEETPPPLESEPEPEPVVKTSPTLLGSNTTTFDYLYEFSETRKVLEDFFKVPTKDEEKKIVDSFVESDTGSLVSSNLELNDTWENQFSKLF